MNTNLGLNHNFGDRQGISRIEVCALLVVIFFLAIFIPAFILQSREKSRQSDCKNRLKNLGLGLHNYHDTFSAFPLGCVGIISLPPENRWSWYLGIGNYVAGHYGTPEVDYDHAWDDPTLRPLHLQTWKNNPYRESKVPLVPFPEIKCPNGTSLKSFDGQPFADYVGITGVGSDAATLSRKSPRAGVWSYGNPTKLKEISDGATFTLFVTETTRENGCWLAGGPPTLRPFDPQLPALIGKDAQFGGLHPEGAHSLFVDGSVRTLSVQIHSEILSAISTICGAESIHLESIAAQN